MNNPQLDVITLTKNSESNIHLTLESVSQQTYPYINHIIVDGSSQDATLDLLHRFKHSKNLEIYTDANFFWI